MQASVPPAPPPDDALERGTDVVKTVAVVAGTVALGLVTGTVSGVISTVVLVVSTVVEDCSSARAGSLVVVGMVSFIAGMAALVLCGWRPRP